MTRATAGALALAVALAAIGDASAQRRGAAWLETPVDGTVVSLACTPDAAYLLGTSGSISRFDGTTWSDVTPLEDAEWNDHLLAWPDGRLVVAGPGRVVQLVGERWAPWPVDPRLSGIECALGLPTGEIYVGARGAIGVTTADGVLAFEAGGWRAVESLAGTAPDDLWTAEDGGVVRHWDGTRWERTSTEASWVDHLLAFAPDDVWAATSGAALHWDGRAWSRIEAGLGTPTIGAIGGAPDRVYAVTIQGIFRLRGDTWVREHELRRSGVGPSAGHPRGVCMTRTHVVAALARVVVIAPR